MNKSRTSYPKSLLDPLVTMSGLGFLLSSAMTLVVSIAIYDRLSFKLSNMKDLLSPVG